MNESLDRSGMCAAGKEMIRCPFFIPGECNRGIIHSRCPEKNTGDDSNKKHEAEEKAKEATKNTNKLDEAFKNEPSNLWGKISKAANSISKGVSDMWDSDNKWIKYPSRFLLGALAVATVLPLIYKGGELLINALKSRKKNYLEPVKKDPLTPQAKLDSNKGKDEISSEIESSNKDSNSKEKTVHKLLEKVPSVNQSRLSFKEINPVISSDDNLKVPDEKNPSLQRIKDEDENENDFNNKYIPHKQDGNIFHSREHSVHIQVDEVNININKGQEKYWEIDPNKIIPPLFDRQTLLSPKDENKDELKNRNAYDGTTNDNIYFSIDNPLTSDAIKKGYGHYSLNVGNLLNEGKYSSPIIPLFDIPRKKDTKATNFEGLFQILEGASWSTDGKKLFPQEGWHKQYQEILADQVDTTKIEMYPIQEEKKDSDENEEKFEDDEGNEEENFVEDYNNKSNKSNKRIPNSHNTAVHNPNDLVGPLEPPVIGVFEDNPFIDNDLEVPPSAKGDENHNLNANPVESVKSFSSKHSQLVLNNEIEPSKNNENGSLLALESVKSSDNKSLYPNKNDIKDFLNQIPKVEDEKKVGDEEIILPQNYIINYNHLNDRVVKTQNITLEEEQDKIEKWEHNNQVINRWYANVLKNGNTTGYRATLRKAAKKAKKENPDIEEIQLNQKSALLFYNDLTIGRKGQDIYFNSNDTTIQRLKEDSKNLTTKKRWVLQNDLELYSLPVTFNPKLNLNLDSKKYTMTNQDQLQDLQENEIPLEMIEGKKVIQEFSQEISTVKEKTESFHHDAPEEYYYYRGDEIKGPEIYQNEIDLNNEEDLKHFDKTDQQREEQMIFNYQKSFDKERKNMFKKINPNKLNNVLDHNFNVLKLSKKQIQFIINRNYNTYNGDFINLINPEEINKYKPDQFNFKKDDKVEDMSSYQLEDFILKLGGSAVTPGGPLSSKAQDIEDNYKQLKQNAESRPKIIDQNKKQPNIINSVSKKNPKIKTYTTYNQLSNEIYMKYKINEIKKGMFSRTKYSVNISVYHANQEHDNLEKITLRTQIAPNKESPYAQYLSNLDAKKKEIESNWKSNKTINQSNEANYFARHVFINMTKNERDKLLQNEIKTAKSKKSKLTNILK